jgi:hypothetical protein
MTVILCRVKDMIVLRAEKFHVMKAVAAEV